MVSPADQRAKALFERVFPAGADRGRQRHPVGRAVRSSKDGNVLLRISEDGKFVEDTEFWGLDYTYWSWNARFADLDLDGFQDLYVANGSFQELLLTPNLLYLNRRGSGLERVADSEAGDFFPTSNYTYLDFDNDGDLDIVTAPPNGALRLFRNQARNGVVVFQLRDLQGPVIGATLTVSSGAGNQFRELKASGGFNSFDAPLVHFGLGELKKLKALKIRWSDGRRTDLSFPFETGYLYRIERDLKDTQKTHQRAQ